MKLYKAGESHGALMTGMLVGVPSGICVDVNKINADLKLRNEAFGRSERQLAENDELAFITGVYGGVTSGNNISFAIKNRVRSACVYSNGAEEASEELPLLTELRPGHADLPGTDKYRFSDARPIAEGASARNTCIDVAAGGIALSMLSALGISVVAFVRSVGNARDDGVYEFKNIKAAPPLFSADGRFDQAFKNETLYAKEKGDSVGGTLEIRVDGLKSGFGSYTAESRINGAIARDLFGIQAVKGVFFGKNPFADGLYGTEYADRLDFKNGKIKPTTSNCGGIDGGMTNGGELVVTVGVKPIPTTKAGVPSVDVFGKKCVSARERADVTAVFALCPVLKAVVALTVADAVCQRLGSDNLNDILARYEEL